MKNTFPKNLCIISALGLMVASCSSDDGPKDSPDVDEHKSKHTLLLYAIASNNLYSNLLDDKSEILEAAKSMDLEDLNLLVYEVTNAYDSVTLQYGEAVLSEIVKDDEGNCSFEEIKTYDRNRYSTDPQRISEVINNAISLRPAESYGLMLWSHGTGIDVTTSTHPTLSTRSSGTSACDTISTGFASIELKSVTSFGSDYNKNVAGSYYDEINVDELADAIPDNVFNFIWFDACYMAGIETIYQLRDKCRYFIGYPTEVYNPGVPYHLTIPYLLAEEPDVTGAAEAFFNYYADNSSASMRVATVAVVDMSKIEPVADFCKSAYSADITATTTGLQCYTRSTIGPFYDFGQYTRQLAEANPDSQDISVFETAMDDFVLWSASTDKDFNFRAINKENLSVISCWLFDRTAATEKAKYYYKLDWYKRVYPQE